MQNTKDNGLMLNADLLFLIICCQTNPNKDNIEFIHSYLNTTHLEINTLIGLANQHGILPLVYKNLIKLHENYPDTGSESGMTNPEDSLNTNHQLPITNHKILSAFKQQYLLIARHNMLMSAELIRIMKLLEENRIEAIAFKGPTLSQMTYGDITLRQYSDLDILVDEKHLYQTAELIVDQNYEPMDSIEFLKNRAKLHVEKNYEFYGRKNGIKVEIHWRLINSSFLKKFKNYDVFTAPQDIKINQTDIPTLDTKILLLYLSNHGASHMWERLEWIVDIDRLIKSEEASLNWDEILKLASTLQSRTTLLLGLGLSRELFNTKLPSNIHSLLDSAQISSLVALILNTFESDLLAKDHTSHEKNLKVFQFHLALQDSLATKAGFILQTLFGYSDRDVMMVNLPRPFFFLYYPLRILRIINKYTFEPLKNVFVKFSQ